MRDEGSPRQRPRTCPVLQVLHLLPLHHTSCQARDKGRSERSIAGQEIVGTDGMQRIQSLPHRNVSRSSLSSNTPLSYALIGLTITSRDGGTRATDATRGESEGTGPIVDSPTLEAEKPELTLTPRNQQSHNKKQFSPTLGLPDCERRRVRVFECQA